MDSLSIRRPVHWVLNYEITEADQPIAPIKGILRTLRSNQWLVLCRVFGKEQTEFFPFRKRELVERFADADPLSIASEVLRLPERGATALMKRIWRTAWDADQPMESSRMVWVDKRGMLLGIGVPREERERQLAIGSYCKVSGELEPQAYMMEEVAEAGVLEKAGDDGREEPEGPKAGAVQLVWVEERGMPRGFGFRELGRERQEVIGSYFKVSGELEPQANMMGEVVEAAALARAGDDGREKPEEPKAGAGQFWVVPVFYATDRKRNPHSSGEDIRYTNKREPNEIVSRGVCSVSIPRTHELGELERPPKWKIWARLKQSQHIMLLSTTELPDDEFWQLLDASIAESAKQDAFIFVHGYKVSFEDAALRTAQLATDLSFEGGPVMFSWPSEGKLLGYVPDEGTIQWSWPHLKKFIEDVCRSSNAKAVHLIAHSMGSRALVEVAQALSTSSLPKGTLKQLIFAAPDVDSGVFRQAARVLSTMCERVTLYASDNDQALRVSKTIHGYSRAGEAGTGILLVAGVDTIDASLVSTDFLGHSGFATASPLMQDIYYLVQHGHSPDQRFGLVQRPCASGTYWSFKAGI